MKKEKIEKYNLTASIHTFTVRSSNEPVIPAHVKTDVARVSYMKRTQEWRITINPNKFNTGDIYAYSEFKALTRNLFESMKIPECRFYRTDIRLDSYEDNFDEYYKLNLMLISLLSIELNDPNKQAIGHTLMHSKVLTDISTKNAYWELKYYNKKFQTNDTAKAKARLEFRYLKSPKNVEHEPHEIKEMWFKKLYNIINRYDELQIRCNQELLKAYQDFCSFSKDKKRKGDMLTNFFSAPKNSLSVFTRKQLTNFFELCGVEKSKIDSRVDNLCSNKKIEFFSKEDLRKYIKMIKTSMDDFFLC